MAWLPIIDFILKYLNPFIRGARWLYKHMIKPLPRIIENSCDWSINRPSWRMVEHDNLLIEQFSLHGKDCFVVKLSVVIEYKNNNDRHKIQLDLRNIMVKIKTSGRGIEGRPLTLNIADIAGHEQLEAGETNCVNYLFSCQPEARPILKNKTHCKIFGKLKGSIHTGQIDIYGTYRRVGKGAFVTDIDYQQIENKEN
jgi:hypothetical protein